MQMILLNSVQAKDIGLLIIRVGFGLIFIRHGFPKIVAGKEEWMWLGSQMANLGIRFAPIMWGLIAAYTEFLGGVCLMFGFGTRVICVFMTFAMLVAVVYHVNKGDSWGYISHPLALMIVLIGLMIAGSGIYSLDYFIKG